MPPQASTFQSTIQEIHQLKDHYDQTDPGERGTIHDQLEVHLLELSSTRLTDEEITSNTVTKLIDGLQERFRDDGGVLRILNRVKEDDWVQNVFKCHGRVPKPLLRKYLGYAVDSVTVSGGLGTSSLVRSCEFLYLYFDESSARFNFRANITSVRRLERAKLRDTRDQDSLEEAPALTIDPKDIVNVSFYGRVASLRHGADPSIQKIVRVEFPSPAECEAFIRQLQEHCLDKTLPLFGGSYLFGVDNDPAPDKQSTRACPLHSISIGAEVLQDTDAGERLYLVSHSDTSGGHKRVVVIGRDGFSRLEWTRFCFPVSAVTYCRYDEKCQGITYVLVDGKIVRIVMKSPKAVAALQFQLGLLIKHFSPWWDPCEDSKLSRDVQSS